MCGGKDGIILIRAFVACRFMRDKLYFNLSFLFCKSLSLAIFSSSAFLWVPPCKVVWKDSRLFLSAVSNLTCCRLNLLSKPAFFLFILSNSFSNLSIRLEISLCVSLCTWRLALSKSSSGTKPNTFCVLRTAFIRGMSLVA